MSYNLETIVSWAKRRGFVYPGSDIYGGLANAWDLGPYGTELKRNIEDIWWDFFVKSRENIIGLDSQILMNPKVWEASGHIGGFSDPLIDCKKCKSRERADQLIEKYIEKNFIKPFIKELPEIKKGEPIHDLTQEFKNIDSNALSSIKEKIPEINNLTPEARTFDQQSKFLKSENIKCPKCGASDWTEPKSFNLMFKTQQGILEGEGKDIYMRPETAQGIFVNFRNIIDTMRVRIPFGIAQIGKAFRNEITPGNFLFRVREFYQMEIEYFVENDEQIGLKELDYWKNESEKFWTDIMGVNIENIKFREHDKDELSFYSKGTWDVEYKYPWGWGELQGIAYRTDYDLKQHQEFSNVNMQYIDPKTGKRFVPHVVEPSFGLTRAIMTLMIEAYDEEKYVDGSGKEQTRVVARFKKELAPIKFAILPLVEKDDEIMDIARKVFSNLKNNYMCEFDGKGNIGKRYRRQDEIGTPYCITIDYQTKQDGTVTLRDRDTMGQKRLKIEDITF